MARFSGIAVEPGAVRAPSAALQKRRGSAARCLGAASEALAGLGRGMHVFGLTKGQFSMIDLSAAVLAITGPAEVAVWTWCIAEYEVEALTAFMADRRILALRMVMDWAGAQRDMPVVAELQARFGDDWIRVTKTHAKIVTVSNADGWRVVIRGSINLNANPRFEQFDVSDDPAVFGVVDGVMTELWARGKPLPVSRLAHADAVALLAVEQQPVAAPSWAPGAGGSNWWGDARTKAGRGGG